MVLLLLAVARLTKDLVTPFSLRDEMTKKDNRAVGTSVAGYYAGVLIVILGPLSTPLKDPVPLWQDLLVTGAYALLGIALLNGSRVIVDRVLLRDFSTVKELVKDRNVGTGAVEMGAYIASGLIIAGSLHGHGGGPHTAVIFFVLGQLGLALYGLLYRLTCRYDVHGEIERDNVAAGVSLGLNLVAVGVVIMRGVSGDFIDWTTNLVTLGTVFVVGAVLLLVLRLLVDLILLPGVKLHAEIVDDRNLNAAWVEGTALTGVAAVLAFVL
jgi:uncharacterized membrane protein YjfL (UPF0719 family)